MRVADHRGESIPEHAADTKLPGSPGALVCMTVYLRGAFEVIRRLGGVAVYAKPERR